MTARGIRNNNPGNIEFNARSFAADPWRGEVGPETMSDGTPGRFTTFDTPAHGIRALARILMTYHRRYGLSSVAGIINRWAPPSENDSGAYVRHVAAQLGVEPDEDLPFDRPEVARLILRDLAAAIIRHENGEQPYDMEVIEAGVDLALEA